jgi:hypothetical protein
MGLETLCISLFALLLGVVICFGGYRLFLLLLPIWGFFFGFFLGASGLEALFGGGFLATVTGWVVGFFVGLIFAVLSYLFYVVAVAIMAGSLGYSLGAGFLHLIGIDLGVLVFIVGLVVAIVVAAVTLLFNLQKYVIIIATAVGGAAMVIGTLMMGGAKLTLVNLVENPIQTMFQDSPIWFIIFLVVAALGIVLQLAVNRTYTIEAYENRI